MFTESTIKMLLASFGLDPVKVKAQVTEGLESIKTMVAHFDKKLTAIEAKQDRILALLEKEKSSGLAVAHINGVDHSEPQEK